MRLIDADALKNYMAEKYVMYDHTFDDIDAQPTIDAVPVVRCKDCKYNALHPKAGNTLCKQGITLYQHVDFCSLGERREDG